MFGIFVLKEHRAEIDARDSTFQAFEDFGKELLDKEHYASPDIQEKLDIMAKEREELEKWVAQNISDTEPWAYSHLPFEQLINVLFAANDWSTYQQQSLFVPETRNTYLQVN